MKSGMSQWNEGEGMGWINPHLRHLHAVFHGFQAGIPVTRGGFNSSFPVWSHPMERCDAGEGIVDKFLIDPYYPESEGAVRLFILELQRKGILG